MVCTAHSPNCPFFFLEASLSDTCRAPDGQETLFLAIASLLGPQPLGKYGTFSAAVCQALWLNTRDNHLTQQGRGVPV